MNRSIVLVAVCAALALTACTSTPTPDNNATSTPASPTTQQATVVTEVVTQTVTNPPAQPAKPVIGSFGYGDLKLGMTRQQALDAKLIGPATGPDNGDCTGHEITGTGQSVWVSKKLGVASIVFTPEMTSDGVGVGATEATLKAEYTNLQPTGPNYSYRAAADNNSAAGFLFRVAEGKVTAAILLLNNQDCHN
ncbi:hypothetical protein ACWGE0_09250 [Lentzea sp. NPDC054927]